LEKFSLSWYGFSADLQLISTLILNGSKLVALLSRLALMNLDIHRVELPGDKLTQPRI